MASGSNEFTVSLTTDSSGDATGYTPAFIGWVDWIKIARGDLASGAADVTITVENTGEPVLALSNIAADSFDRPRVLVQGADGADITGAYTQIFVHNSRLKIVVAQGGDTKTGAVTVLKTDIPAPVIA